MTTTPQIPDLRPLVGSALDQTGRLIRETVAADASLPTPCDEWDVAALIGHQQAVVRRIGAVLSGKPFDSVPRMIESVEWTADWDDGRAATDQVLADDAILDRVVSVPWGQTTGRTALGMYAAELATHAWDLAVATDRVHELDQSLAAAALPGIQAGLPAEPRGGPQIPFGEVVEVGPEASAYERLVAWEGRDPAWSAD